METPDGPGIWLLLGSAYPDRTGCPLTLVAFALASYGVFALIERMWIARIARQESPDGPDRVRHVLFCWAGFLAFNCFYAFAGAPTLRELPLGLYSLFQAGILVISSCILYTRLSRSREKQWKFDQARKWLSRWPWADERPPQDLGEAYHAYTLRAKVSEGRLQAYKDAVRNMLVDNLPATASSGMVERLAADLGVAEADQKRILREIGREFPELFGPYASAATGDHLRLIGYRGELEQQFANGGLPTETELTQMQERFRIEPGEHAEIMLDVLDPEGIRGRQIRAEAEEIVRIRHDAAVLAAYPSPATHFLTHQVRQDLHDARKHMLDLVSLYGPDKELEPLRHGVITGEPAACDMLEAWVRQYLPAALSATVVDALCRLEGATPGNEAASSSRSEPTNQTYSSPGSDPAGAPLRLAGVLLRLSEDPDCYTRAAAIQSLGVVLDQPGTALRLQRGLEDPNPLVQETAQSVLARMPLDGGLAASTTPDRMFALRSVVLFGHLSADQLCQLAERAEEVFFEPGDVLCFEGLVDNLVYILLEGEAEAVQDRNGMDVQSGLHRAGECVGEMSILDPGPHLSTVRALTAVRALGLHGEDFRSLVASDSTTALGLLRMVASRQRQTRRVPRPGV